MLGRSAEGPQAATQGRQASSPLSPHQTAEMSQKASDAFDAAAAGGLNNMAELKAVTSDIMSSQSRQDGASRSPSPHMASVEHLSPAANLAMLQACVRWVAYTPPASLPRSLDTMMQWHHVRHPSLQSTNHKPFAMIVNILTGLPAKCQVPSRQVLTVCSGSFLIPLFVIKHDSHYALPETACLF